MRPKLRNDPIIVGPNEKLHGSIGVMRPKLWNDPQIVGPNEKPTWFHRGFSLSLSFFNN
jgi:hypothetical protein